MPAIDVEAINDLSCMPCYEMATYFLVTGRESATLAAKLVRLAVNTWLMGDLQRNEVGFGFYREFQNLS